MNNTLGNHLEKCIPFSDIQYGFNSSCSAEDFLTDMAIKMARACNIIFSATWVESLDI